MTRAPLLRAVLALAVLTLSTWVASTQSARLGRDLRGGTQIVLETRHSPTAVADDAATKTPPDEAGVPLRLPIVLDDRVV